MRRTAPTEAEWQQAAQQQTELAHPPVEGKRRPASAMRGAPVGAPKVAATTPSEWKTRH